jgi:crotonobetainyl-CoA:carnitine CoA-transferase CaiB-like acyl-CoA transferase
VLAGGNDRLFRRTCEVIGRPELAEDDRYATNPARVAHRDELVDLLAEVFATRTAQGWLDALGSASVPCSPIRTMDEVVASPEGEPLVESVADPAHGGELRLIANPLRFDGERLPTRLPPPALDESGRADWSPRP